MNKYRVDRAMEGVSPPVGMNSILYMGDSYEEAVKVFTYHNGGINEWSQTDRDYGLMLSIWDDWRNMYVAKRFKSK